VYRNSYFDGDGEPDPNGYGGRCNDLFGGFRNVNGYGCYFLQLVTCHGLIGNDRGFRHSESNDDNNLYDRRYRQRLYGNHNSNGDGEPESDGGSEFADDLCGWFCDVNGYGCNKL
jgi:hypothetical protein